MSDLAAPLLVVEGDEAAAYLAFVALMRRLHTQFIGEGHTLRTKLDHLALLVAHHDPTFYAYLTEHGAEDMFFTYRWLLLEMKREFPLDDALYMLEVMWSTLPIDLPPDGEGLSLVDPSYWLERSAVVTNPSATYVNLKARSRRVSNESANERRMSLTLHQSLTPVSVTAVSSLEGGGNKLTGDNPTRVMITADVPHLNEAHTPCEELDPSEFLPVVKTRELEELEKTSGRIDASLGGCRQFKGQLDIELGESLSPAGISRQKAVNGSEPKRSSVVDLVPSGQLKRPAASDCAQVSNTTMHPPRRHLDLQTDVSCAHLTESCSCTDSRITSPGSFKQEDAPIITSTRSVLSSSFSTVPSPSQVPPSTVPTTAVVDPDIPVHPTSITNDPVSSTDSAVDDPPTELTRLLETESVNFVKNSPTEGEPRPVPPRLPPPAEFGDGNPFLMFLCLVSLLQQRDQIMTGRMDYNDLAMHYHKMTRKHDVLVVVSDARVLYSAYLKQQQLHALEDARNSVEGYDLNV